MKTNEAPEKLYLDTTDNPDNVWLRAYRLPFNKLPFDPGIEYTRTDVFIEKACEWLKDNKEHPLIGCEDTGLSGFLTEEFIAEFRKTMKGEQI